MIDLFHTLACQSRKCTVVTNNIYDGDHREQVQTGRAVVHTCAVLQLKRVRQLGDSAVCSGF